MTPAVILRELSRVRIGDIHLPTNDGRQLVLRRVARPEGEPQHILTAVGLAILERLDPDHVL